MDSVSISVKDFGKIWVLGNPPVPQIPDVPILVALRILVALWRGLKVTPNGHIATDLIIYPLIISLSYLSPFLGMFAAALYGVGDIAQKLVVDDIFYFNGVRTPLDYVGALIGYVISYSSLIFAGAFPGILTRIFRLEARALLSRSSSTADGAVPSNALPHWLIDTAAGMAGAFLGGVTAMAAVAPVLEIPAFYLRPNPDAGCHASEILQLRGGSPMGGLGGAGGGLTTDPDQPVKGIGEWSKRHRGLDGPLGASGESLPNNPATPPPQPPPFQGDLPK